MSFYNNKSEERERSWWTGPRPLDKLHSLPQLRLQNTSRENFLEYFNNSWLMTEVLFSALQSEEAFYKAPYHQLRHPLIFYYGHPAVLYVNKLRLAGLHDGPVDDYFENLFAVGVDEMSWDDMSKNEMKWPAIAQVTEYRRKVYKIVSEVIKSHPALGDLAGSVLQNTPVWSLAMGFEHERIHFETSTVLMRELPLASVAKPRWWPEAFKNTENGKKTTNDWVTFESTEVEIGKPDEVPTFGWDNEYGKRIQTVKKFDASRYLISNGEFHKFVTSGGYREPQFWSVEGWKWRQFRNSKWPVFWIPEGPDGLLKFKLRTTFEITALDFSLPAVVNYHEAQAYCAYRSAQDQAVSPYRLLTEAEHHRIREKGHGDEKWNNNLVFGAECPVTVHAPHGVGDVFGNVWQWCEDEFYPLPGFRVHSLYEDFSTPCFDSKHQMIMGGSFVSTGDEASTYARFQFRPHFFQHAGFRMVRSPERGARSDAIKLGDNQGRTSSYENLELLNQYMQLHFGQAHSPSRAEGQAALPYAFGPKDALGFPQRCAEVVTKHVTRLKIQADRALDVGCAVGGSTFALARAFKEVVGIDLSSSFIAAANELKMRGTMSYFRKDEGHLGAFVQGAVPPEVDRERATFRVGDACALPSDIGNFNAVLMANLLCRLPDPKKCLNQVRGKQSFLKSGGLLVLLSPYSWLEEHTKIENWLGGLDRGGKPLKSAENLRLFLQDEFTLIEEANEPLLIREHARKYQYIVAHLMVWQKK